MRRSAALLACCLLPLLPSRAHAGPYGDDLTKCLVASTSDADKTLLVKWIFSAIGLHHEVAGYVDLPAEVRTQLNKDTGALFTRLMAESCRAQTRDAVKYEGAAAISNAFQVLGSVASQQIFAAPEVAAGMTELAKYMDTEKLQSIGEDEPAPAPEAH